MHALKHCRFIHSDYICIRLRSKNNIFRFSFQHEGLRDMPQALTFRRSICLSSASFILFQQSNFPQISYVWSTFIATTVWNVSFYTCHFWRCLVFFCLGIAFKYHYLIAYLVLSWSTLMTLLLVLPWYAGTSNCIGY